MNHQFQLPDDLSQSGSQSLVSDSDNASANDAAKPSNVQSPVQFRGPIPVMPVRPGMPPPPLGQMSFVPPNFRAMMMPFVSIVTFGLLTVW